MAFNRPPIDHPRPKSRLTTTEVLAEVDALMGIEAPKPPRPKPMPKPVKR